MPPQILVEGVSLEPRVSRVFQRSHTFLSCRNYLLAQAHVDAPALATSIANLNTTTTFSPLQPLQDTDVTGYLRHAHEQNLISTIEEGRRETQEEFYRSLQEHGRREWEAKKKRVFEELGGRLGVNSAVSDLKKSSYGRTTLTVSRVFRLRPAAAYPR